MNWGHETTSAAFSGIPEAGARRQESGFFCRRTNPKQAAEIKPSILASSERRPNFLSAQSLSSVINLVDSFDAILLYAISGEFYL
jgi:hypothetical protein